MILRIGAEQGYWGEKVLEANVVGRDRLGRSEVEELRVDYSRLNQICGWSPQFSWEHGLRETIKWYAENREAWTSRVDWE